MTLLVVTLLYIMHDFASHPWSWEQLSTFCSMTMTSGPRSPWTA